MSLNLIEKVLTDLQVTMPDLTYIKPIKAGKEAEVHLVSDEGKLLALKIYKQFQKYSSKGEYMPTKNITSRTLRKAIEQKGRYGRKAEQELWTTREYRTLKNLSLYSDYIPKVYNFCNEAIIMDYLGTLETPAPRLSDLILPELELEKILKVILKQVKLFIDLGFVHGDLSAYNILFFNGKPYIIDFPQILLIRQNENAFKRLLSDTGNIKSYFARVWKEDYEREIENLFLHPNFVN